MRKREIGALFVLALLLAGCQSSAAMTTPPTAANDRGSASSAPTGIVIPMYMYPGAQWNAVIAQKSAHPNVPIVVIANVNNGAGRKKQAVYTTYIAREQAAGVSVIGYVATSYGKRSATSIEAEMSRWYRFYRVDGIFLDEMKPNDSALYATVTAYAHAHALPFVMGNPGENAKGNSGPDVINYWEQRGYPPLSFLKQSAHVAYGKSRWSYIAGAVPYDAATIRATTRYVGYLYATDGKEPECYCRLPSYFSQLVALLAKGLAHRR